MKRKYLIPIFIFFVLSHLFAQNKPDKKLSISAGIETRLPEVFSKSIIGESVWRSVLSIDLDYALSYSVGIGLRQNLSYQDVDSYYIYETTYYKPYTKLIKDYFFTLWYQKKRKSGVLHKFKFLVGYMNDGYRFYYFGPDVNDERILIIWDFSHPGIGIQYTFATKRLNLNLGYYQGRYVRDASQFSERWGFYYFGPNSGIIYFGFQINIVKF